MNDHEIVSVSREIAGRTLSLETGRLARLTNGAVTVSYGETIVFAAATMSPSAREGIDFFPLTVDYREPYYAAGKYPGGFFKREGRPADKETLTSRCIDRPIRPLFPDGFNHEVQLLLTVLSYDQENDPDIVGMIAAFAALEISDIPFHGPLGAVRIGRLNGELVANPGTDVVDDTTLNLTIAGAKNAIMMVEGGANEESEEVMLDALDLAQDIIRQVVELVEEFRERCGKPKMEFTPEPIDEDIYQRVERYAADRIPETNGIADKQARQDKLDIIFEDVKERILNELAAEFEEQQAQLDEAAKAEAAEKHRERMAKAGKNLSNAFHDLEKNVLRERILSEGVRSDDRNTDEIRPIQCEVNVIPRVHGSAIFTRGQTQSLAIATLGTVSDEQKVDGIATEEYYKKFFLHYNFPPYCVGEVRPMRGPGRREIGHGALAERSVVPVLPEYESFPYTIRAVSNIMMSNGSSSMASVCGTSLALMDAGVPIKAPVAGIAMGLISDGERFAVLSDILGVEDHLGDMDFKVAGTREGITSFQMDLKIEGITREIMEKALHQAKQGREHILQEMEKALDKPRENLRPFAPRIQTMMIPIDKIRDVIGPSGKMIRKIITETGAKIDIDDDGRVVIASTSAESGEKAREWIDYLTEEVEMGRIYHGKVTRIVNFGAFVEVLPGQEGLVHISQIAPHRVNEVTDELNEGDEVDVKIIEIDEFGRINLSKVEADRELGRITPQQEEAAKASRSGGGGRGGDRGGRGGGGRGGDRGGRGGGGGGKR